MNDEIPSDIIDEMMRQLRAEHAANWSKLKKLIDVMDNYDLITFWYELEILFSWDAYYIHNDEFRKRAEEACKNLMKIGTDDMVRATRHKLSFLSLFGRPDVSPKCFVKLRRELGRNAMMHGTLLAMRMGKPMFETFNIRMIADVRKELLRRFAKSIPILG
jgi:hypothetical protein